MGKRWRERVGGGLLWYQKFNFSNSTSSSQLLRLFKFLLKSIVREAVDVLKQVTVRKQKRKQVDVLIQKSLFEKDSL